MGGNRQHAVTRDFQSLAHCFCLQFAVSMLSGDGARAVEHTTAGERLHRRAQPSSHHPQAKLMYRYNDVSKRGECTHLNAAIGATSQHLQTRSPRVIERCSASRLDPCIWRPSERGGGCRRMQLVEQPCLIPWAATSFQGWDAFGNSGSR